MLKGGAVVLLDFDSAAELAHHETDEFFEGHFLAVEVHLIVGVMQFGDDVVAVQFRQLQSRTAMLLNMSAVAVALIGNEFGVGLTVELRLHGEYVERALAWTLSD